MLYLEDYVEMIEHLPQELRDRFTEMREMDLGVQNSMDSLEKKVKIFFANAKKMKPSEKEAEYEAIRREYYKTLEDADEKVHLANQMYDLVDRYLRRLDQELHKFKMELEADNKGITEILEKRSLELDQPPTNSSQKENRYSFTTSSRSRDNHSHSRAEKRRDSNASSTSIEKRLAIEKISPSLPESRPASANSGPIIAATSVPSTPTAIANSVGSVSYNLGHIGAGGNAIAAAASQAIAATQQMQHGRRTASLKASYEAINTGGVHAAEFSRELAGAAQTAIAAIQQETTKKHKKKVTAVPSSSVVAASVQQPVSPPVITTNTQVVDSDNPDWTYDPNEPRYCICNQVSYGDMVACDNSDCPFEWFHYPCVGITAPPKGKWYCPQCTSSMKRRGGNLKFCSDTGYSCCVPRDNCPYSNTGIDIRIVNGNSNCPAGQVCCCSSSSGNLVDSSCGVRKIPVSAHPQGQASYGAYPWQAALLTTNDVYVGSGVLITPNHVLTVAHKVASYTNGGLKVRLGEWDEQSTSETYPYQEYSIKQISIHSQFNSANLQNDVAVITLNSTVPISSSPNINTACLPTGIPAASTRCWVSGWGKDAFGANGKYQSITKEVDVPIVDQSVCENALRQTRLGRSFMLNKNSFICAGGEQGKDACTGDGGSPLVCQFGNNQWQVVGIVAWGIGCATSNIPGVYVNVYNYIPWITQQITQSK